MEDKTAAPVQPMAAGDVEQLAGRGLVRVRLTLRDAGVDILLVGNKVVKRNLFIRQRVNSDGAQGDLTELWKIFRQQVSGFVAVECDGEIGVDCILRRFTGVTVDAAGNIQREYSGDGRIDFFGDLAAAHIHLAVESAARRWHRQSHPPARALR